VRVRDLTRADTKGRFAGTAETLGRVRRRSRVLQNRLHGRTATDFSICDCSTLLPARFLDPDAERAGRRLCALGRGQSK